MSGSAIKRNDEDTIFALATGARRAAIAIIRISGSAAPAVAHRMTGRALEERVAAFVRLRDPASGELLDHCIAILFAAGRSETGEASVEFQLHGSPAVVSVVLTVLGRQPGLRPALAGEFARRAFRNGTMDLAQVEGLADLIDAETEWQRRQAQRQLSGGMRDAIGPWRDALLRARADVETAIDFAEDVELADGLHAKICATIAPIRAALAAELAGGAVAERIRDGVQIVIAGPPNAGKSTLLNALARREAAIVSSIAGTTRDPIEIHLDLEGMPVTLVDTAGLRDGGDAIEQIGIARAKGRADAADLVLWLSDDGAAAPPFVAPVWAVRTKADAGLPARLEAADLAISARTGHNVDALVVRLATFTAALLGAAERGIVTRQRHRKAFTEALASLDALAGDRACPPEIMAERLRAAGVSLAQLVGAVDVEDILGDVFSRFCIGK